MLLVAPVHKSIRQIPSKQDMLKDERFKLTKRVSVKRSSLPAITHVDYSARLQTVTEYRNGRYYRLIKKFEERTKTGVIVNTSFNVKESL